MAYIAKTNTFVAGTLAQAAQVNTNFDDLVNGLKDGTKDITIKNITASGKIGINTTAPTKDFEIYGNNANTISMGMNGTGNFNSGDVTIGLTAAGGGYMNMVATNGVQKIRFNSGSGALSYIDNAGKLGIGTRIPETKVHISGGILTISEDSAVGIIFKETGTNASTTFLFDGTNTIYYNGVSELIRLDDNGQMMIGTDTPAGLLTVNGITDSQGFSNKGSAGVNGKFTAGANTITVSGGLIIGIA